MKGKDVHIQLKFFVLPDGKTARINSMSLSPYNFNGRVNYGIVGKDEELTFEELREELKKYRFHQWEKNTIHLFVKNKETGKRQNFGINVLMEDWPKQKKVGDIISVTYKPVNIAEYLKGIGIKF